jgi:hypothetical protein
LRNRSLPLELALADLTYSFSAFAELSGR